MIITDQTVLQDYCCMYSTIIWWNLDWKSIRAPWAAFFYEPPKCLITCMAQHTTHIILVGLWISNHSYWYLCFIKIWDHPIVMFLWSRFLYTCLAFFLSIWLWVVLWMHWLCITVLCMLCHSLLFLSLKCLSSRNIRNLLNLVTYLLSIYMIIFLFIFPDAPWGVFWVPLDTNAFPSRVLNKSLIYINCKMA